MKQPVIIILVVVLTSNCTYSPRYIERMAKRTVVISELDALLDGYVSSFYRMPETMSEIAEYYEASVDSSVNSDQRYCLEAYLNSPQLLLKSYQDSCFIYDVKNRIGCCYYGLPQTYLNAPWHSGYSLFLPSVISNNGIILKGFEERIMEDLRAIWSHYSKEIYVKVTHHKTELDSDISVKQVSEYYIPYRQLYTYSQAQGLVKCFSQSPDSISFTEVDTFTNETTPLAEHCIELSSCLQHEIELYMRDLLSTNPEIHRIYFFTYYLR